MTTTQAKIETLQTKIASAEDKARTSTQADRDKLAELQAQHEREQAAERQRLVEHREAWAHHYLARERQQAEAEARKNVTQARREFEAELAQAPWVVALLNWQRALNEQAAVMQRTAYAQSLTGQSPAPVAGASNVLPMMDSEVAFTPIGRVLHYLADSVEQVDVQAEIDALPAVDGAAEIDKNADPLAYLARTGTRLDATEHTTVEGESVTMHRNPLTGEWVKTSKDGTVIAASWKQAKAEGRPNAPIDGSQHGSRLDTETGKFTKVRLN